MDGTVRLWNTDTGTCVQTLVPPGPYAGMNIAGATGLSDMQRAALQALGAEESTATAPTQDARLSHHGTSVRLSSHLTARELDVLREVAEGATDQDVAARLGLRSRTVTSYLTSIYAKLDVRTRTAAVRVARQQHVI
jgi:DNA-binding CsgD family transcriptional regulator